MKKLIANIKPFTFTQTVLMIDEENEVKEKRMIPMNKFEESVLTLASELEIDILELGGVKIYTKEIQKRIESIELKKYGKNTLKIELI